jgi:hypothetical protein
MRILITGARTFADVLDAENAAAARRGLTGRFSSPHDAFGAIPELVSRQLRLGLPPRLLELAPVIDRLIFELMESPSASGSPRPRATPRP